MKLKNEKIQQAEERVKKMKAVVDRNKKEIEALDQEINKAE